MISSLDPASQILLADLDRMDERIGRANQQISSGLRVSVASDAPASLADILDLRAGIDQMEQFQSNMARVKTEADIADTALQNAVKLMDRARSLGSMGATATYDQVSRDVMAAEVRGILETMVAIAGTTANGRYVFGGDNDTTVPYTYDPTQPDSVDRTNAPPVSTRLIEGANGSRFASGLSAQEIFDADPTKSAFIALSRLADELQNGDSSTVNAVMDLVRSAGEHVNSQLTYYGLLSTNIQNATNSASRQEVQLRTNLSSVRDTDVAEAALELQQATVNQQAALGAFSKRPHNSLFDYLG